MESLENYRLAWLAKPKPKDIFGTGYIPNKGRRGKALAFKTRGGRGGGAATIQRVAAEAIQKNEMTDGGGTATIQMAELGDDRGWWNSHNTDGGNKGYTKREVIESAGTVTIHMVKARLHKTGGGRGGGRSGDTTEDGGRQGRRGEERRGEDKR